MRTKLQPYEENQICLAFFHGKEIMYNLALLNIEQDIVHNWLYRHYRSIYSQLQKPGKDCFKCFVL